MFKLIIKKVKNLITYKKIERIIRRQQELQVEKAYTTLRIEQLLRTGKKSKLTPEEETEYQILLIDLDAQNKVDLTLEQNKLKLRSKLFVDQVQKTLKK